MFGRSNHKEASVSVPETAPVVVIPPGRPAPQLQVQGNVVSLSSYQTLAKELGFRPAQLLKEEILRFLAESQIPTFDYEKVDMYLRHIARQENKSWIWRPLRDK